MAEWVGFGYADLLRLMLEAAEQPNFAARSGIASSLGVAPSAIVAAPAR
jgi:hypothetical protein